MTFPFPFIPAAAVTGGVETLIGFGTGTVIGDMTAGGGNAKAFDGTTSAAVGSSQTARKNATTTGYVGKSWTGTKTITRYTAYGSSDFGMCDQATFSLALEGSSTGAWAGEEVSLHSDAGIADSNGITKNYASGINTTTAYAYHRVKVTISTGEIYVAEVEFYETI